jgi:hypothetical protein
MGVKNIFCCFIVFILLVSPMAFAASVSPVSSTSGEFCNPTKNECPSNYHCSGMDNAFVTTKCCPTEYEYDFYTDTCFTEGQTPPDPPSPYLEAKEEVDERVSASNSIAKSAEPSALRSDGNNPSGYACDPIPRKYGYGSAPYYEVYGQTASDVTPQLTPINFFDHNVKVHEKVKPAFQCVIIDLQKCKEFQDYEIYHASTYNWRLIGGSTERSMHSWGIAIDINPKENPLGSTLVTDLPQCVVDTFKRYGFDWGGDWGPEYNYDAMHFEFHGDPESVQSASSPTITGITSCGLQQCMAWETCSALSCLLTAPNDDPDGDGIVTKVEVRYWANPMNKNDKPTNRIFQYGCPDYFNPTQNRRYNPTYSSAGIGTLIMLIKSPSSALPSLLGENIGLLHGAGSGLWTDIVGLYDLLGIAVDLTIGVGSKSVKAVIECRGNNFCVVEKMGYDMASSAGSAISTVSNIDFLALYHSELNAWFDARSTFAPKIFEYQEECNNVILTKTYTRGFTDGFMGVQIALLAIPITKVTKVSKVSKFSKFKKLGTAYSKALKIADAAGESKWLLGLSKTDAKKITKIIADIGTKYGDDVAGKITRISSKLGVEAADDLGKAVTKISLKHGDDVAVKFIDDVDKLKDVKGVNNVIKSVASGNIQEILVASEGRKLLSEGKGITTFSRKIKNGAVTEFDIVIDDGRKIYEVSDKSVTNNFNTIKKYLRGKSSIYDNRANEIIEEMPLFKKENVVFRIKVQDKFKKQTSDLVKELGFKVEFV